jgi:hypothetical protein
MKKIILTTAIFCIALASQAQHIFKNAAKWIPENFNPANITLLVQQIEPYEKKPEKRNAEMEKYLAEKYTYNYAFTSKNEIISTKGEFADLKKFPFGLMIKHFYESHGSYGTISVYDFYFLDRATGIEYPLTKKTSSNPIDLFKPVINTILEKFK